MEVKALRPGGDEGDLRDLVRTSEPIQAQPCQNPLVPRHQSPHQVGALSWDNGWEQTVLLPTSEEAPCFLAYHSSQQHAQADNETIFLAVKAQQFNLAWHTGQKRVSFFQRAHSRQIMQLHIPSGMLVSF